MAFGPGRPGAGVLARADVQARTAADELRAAAVLLRRLADAVQQLGTDMAAAREAERRQLQEEQARVVVPDGLGARELRESLAALAPVHDVSWARRVGALAVTWVQLPAYGPADPGPATPVGVVDTDPVVVRELATVWHTASTEIGAARDRASRRASSLPLAVLDAYGLPGSRAAALLETVLSSTGTAARAALSYQDGAAQAVELDGAFPVTLEDMARDGGGVLSAVSVGRGVALVERESEDPDSLDGSGARSWPDRSERMWQIARLFEQAHTWEQLWEVEDGINVGFGRGPTSWLDPASGLRR